MAPPKNKAAADRRARVEAMRKEQQRRERRTRLLITGVGSIVAIGIVAVIVTQTVHNKSPEGQEILPSAVSSDSAVTTEAAATVVKDTSGIPGVVAYDTSGHTSAQPTDDGHGLPFNHVDGPVVYSVTPPVGGDHNGIWMNCGVYNSPVTTERAVHDMEHGAIWITYEPSLPASEVSQLQALVKKQPTVTDGSGNKERYMDLTPWKDNSIASPIVASSWGHQLKVTSATDPRLQRFIDAFRRNAQTTPEMQADCDGEPAQISGNPLYS